MQRQNEIRQKATKEHKAPDFDVVIIGGGVIGSLISYQLSKYEIKVCLVEKEADLAMEETSANSAIVHAGYDPEPGSNKAKFNILGNEMMEPLCNALNVPFERNGSLVLAFTPEDKEHLLFLMDRGRTNGVKGLAILSPEEVFEMEPFLSKEILCALIAPSGGIVCPYELTLAASEVAHRNGVEYRFEHEVTGIRRMRTLPAYFEVTCSIPGPVASVFRKMDHSSPEQTAGAPARRKEKITCRFVVNAAGAFADVISRMAGDDSFFIIPRRGEYIVLDKTIPCKVRHTVFQTPSAKGKGVLVTPTVEGNMLVGPNAQPVSDPSDTRTTEEGLNEVFQLAKKSVPSLDRKWMIRSFAGIRSTPSTHDFILGESAAVKGFFQAAGIESPGLTSAPAIASELERNILDAFSTKPGLKSSYRTKRKVTVRFRDLSREEQREKIKENPLYAQMICRCEQITEAEVIESIHRPLGAKTINGVKLRTRAGMGRCQSGFCLPRLLPILARELGVPEEAVSLFGTGSEMIKGRTRYDR
jgi:glycerol-3-phosphate dehydrogenase